MKKLFLFLLPLLVIASCGKGPETVTVNPDNDSLFTAPDSVAVSTDDTDDDFIHIKLGESSSIRSLDPLFAQSGSEWRIINLIYEKLISLDDNGDPAPGIAKRWTINDDSTQFVFNLKTDIYFHDSSVFDGNTARRVVASDVKYVFDRMASSKVPDFSAQHFNDIAGFSAYHSEQIQIKDPDLRVYPSIEGIRAPNDSTVIFFLENSTNDLLQRLAHPMASIYPRESIRRDNGLLRQAIGSGAFRFIQKEGNAHLLTINENYSGDLPDINRLDIISGLTERDLFQEFARTNLDALVELGPSSLVTVADTTGTLLQNYQNYELMHTDLMVEYPLYFNKNSGQAGQLNQIIPALNRQSLLINPALGDITINRVDSTSISDFSDSTQFIVTQSEHPFYLFLLNNAAPQISELEYSFSMSASYAMSDKTTFSILPYADTVKFLSWKAPFYILSHDYISGITVNHTPWNLKLSDLNINRSN